MRTIAFFFLLFICPAGFAQEEFTESSLLSLPLEVVEDSLSSAINENDDFDSRVEASIWLARIYTIYGIDDKADSLFKLNRELIIAGDSEKSPWLALNDIQYSKLYQIHEKWPEVKELVSESIDIKMAFSADSTELIDEFNQLVWYYQAIRYFDSANIYADEAIRLSTGLEDPARHYKLAKSYNNKGYTLNYQLKCEGRDWFRKALAETRKQPALHDLTLARIFHNYGNSINDQNKLDCENRLDYAQMISYYDKSLRIYKRYNNPSRIGLNYYVRSVASEKYSNRKASIRLLKKSIEAYNESVVVNEFMLDVVYSRLTLLIGRNTDDVDSLKSSYEFLKQYVIKYQNETEPEKEIGNSLFKASYWMNTNSALVGFTAKLFELTNDSSYLADLQYLASKTKYPSLEEPGLNRLPDENSAIIDYYLTRPDSYALVTTQDKFSIIKLSGLDKVYGPTLEFIKLRQELGPNDYNKRSFQLYEELLLPVFNVIGTDKQKLVIIPDLTLEALDFAALTTSIKENVGFSELPYLLYDYDISYAMSSSLFRPDSGTKKIDFGLFLHDTTDKTLVFSELLTNALDEHYYTGFEPGTEKSLVHLSGHIIPDYDYHYLSKLPAYNQLDSSKFEFENVELLTLHGCRGTDGRILHTEGRLSFNRLFRGLGVQSVITTRWDVDDYYSSKVFKNFYEQLDAGLPKSAALANAQKKFIKEAKSDLEANPKNWGGIVIYGSDAPLDIRKSILESVLSQWYVWLMVVFSLLFLGKIGLARGKGWPGRRQ